MSTYFCLQKMKLRMWCSMLRIFHTRLTDARNLLQNWSLIFHIFLQKYQLLLLCSHIIRYALGFIVQEGEMKERFENMFVRKDSSSAVPPSQLFIDAAVYSRNRCFRVALSSKAGKNSVLLPTERFKCKDMVYHLPCL